MELNEVLRFFRKESGMTQQELSNRTCINHKTISFYETGERKPSIDNLKILAKVYGFNVSKFFDEDEVNEEMRKSEIKDISVVITKDYGMDNSYIYYVEVDVPETGEILDEYTSDCYKKLEEAERYVDTIIEKRFNVINYHIKDLTDVIVVDYVTFWDGGYAELTTKAKYDIESNTVFDVECANTDGIDLEICEREYIILPEGKELDVVKEDDKEDYKEELEDRKMALLLW